MKTPQSSTNSRRSAAFTLLELLVVIAIIVILIGLLSVGLMGARRQAFYKATKGRIAQLELAVQSFYDEFRVYPPDEWGDKNAPADGTMMKFLVDQGYDADADGDLSNEITTSADDTHQDIECLVYAVSVVRPFLELKIAQRSNKESTPDKIEWDDVETMTSPAYEIWDAWNNPLHYAVPDSGTITSLGPNSLTDTNKNWDNDEWIDASVKVGSQIRSVTDNTDVMLTLDPTPPWLSVPSVGDSFTVYFGNPGFVAIWSSGPDGDSSAAGSGSLEDADNVTNWERD